MNAISCQSFVTMLVLVLLRLANGLAQWAGVPGLIAVSDAEKILISKTGEVCSKAAPTPPPPPPPAPCRFDAQIAKQVGADAAAMLETFRGWIAYNIANNDTSVTWRSAKDWVEKEFTWLTERQFRDRLRKLVDAQLVTVQSGRGGDRRLRIALGAQLMLPFASIELPESSNGVTDSSNQQIDSLNKQPKKQKQEPAAAAGKKLPAKSQKAFQEGQEPRRGDDDLHPERESLQPPAPQPHTAIPAEVAAFYAPMNEADLAALPLGAWQWGIHMANSKAEAPKYPVKYAIWHARRWDGQAVPTVEQRDEVPTSDGEDVDDLLANIRAHSLSNRREPNLADAPEWFSVAYNQLEIQLDRTSFATWVQGMRFHEMRDGVAVLLTHSAMARDMLQGRYYRDMRGAFRDALGESVELRFEVGAVAKAA